MININTLLSKSSKFYHEFKIIFYNQQTCVIIEIGYIHIYIILLFLIIYNIIYQRYNIIFIIRIYKTNVYFLLTIENTRLL